MKNLNDLKYSDKVKNVENGDGAKFCALIPSETQNAYGKLIAQHTWYMLFDVNVESASSISTGKTVYVDFPERSIYDVLIGECKITEAMIKTKYKNLYS